MSLSLGTHMLSVDATQALDLTYVVRISRKHINKSNTPLFTFTKVVDYCISNDTSTLLLLLSSRKFAVFHGDTYLMFRPMRGDNSAAFTMEPWDEVEGGFVVHSKLFNHHYYVVQHYRR